MAQYYYDKYNAVPSTKYNDAAPWAGGGLSGVISFMLKAKSYTFDNVGNRYVLSSDVWASNDEIQAGTFAYDLSGASLRRYTADRYTLGNNSGQHTLHTKTPTANSTTTTYTQGTLVQSDIPAEDGTYPAKGRHTDGFWYVKKGLVGPLPPNTIINQPYSTAGNGGRKLVRLSNGTLVSAVWSGTTSTRPSFQILKSINNGTTWEMIRSITLGANGVTDVALATDGIKIFILYIQPVTASNFHATMDVILEDKTVLVNNKGIDSGQTAIGNVSIAIDPTNGHLHAAWASKNATYPNSFNIRYAKSTDGGVTWSAVTQVSNANTTAQNYKNPSIVITNSKLTMVCEHVNSTSINAIYRFTSTNNGSSFTDNGMVFNGGTYAQNNPSAVVDKSGVIHVVWHGLEPANASPHAMTKRSTDGGVTWLAPTTPIPIANNMSENVITTDNKGTLFVVGINFGSLHFYKSNDKGVTWSNLLPIGISDAKTGPSLLMDPTFSGYFDDAPPLIYTTATSVMFSGKYTTNNAPTVTLTSPTTNQTLYENDTLNISGDAYDGDKDQSVTAYFQINNEARKVLATNLSQTQISLSKQLTFKGGKLYDGVTVLTGNLTDGVAHTLKVWAEDSEKASSVIVERAFYVVPNRAPLLSVDAIVPSGVVDADKFTISGTASDQDANANVTVTHRINSGNSTEIYNGPGGTWEFEVSLAQLVVGENTIIVETIDNYGAKTSKTIKLNKNEVKTPILQSVARYKIEPPKGSAKGVLLWIQRDEDLALKVELSMTLQGEQENYVLLTPTNTAPVDIATVEDEFYFEADEAKNNIILKLSTSRTDVNINHKIHLISGVLE